MFTPKEIRDTEFERVSKGYKVEDVDGFLSRLADQIERLMIDKNEADQKLVILAEKVEQYRKDEDALRSALITAERMKDSLLAEATQQKEIMLRDAQQKAEKIVYEAESKIDREEVTLHALKQQVAAFKSEVLSIYKSHLEILAELPDNPEEMNFGKAALEEQATSQNAAREPAFDPVPPAFDIPPAPAYEPPAPAYEPPHPDAAPNVMNDAYEPQGAPPFAQQSNTGGFPPQSATGGFPPQSAPPAYTPPQPATYPPQPAAYQPEAGAPYPPQPAYGGGAPGQNSMPAYDGFAPRTYGEPPTGNPSYQVPRKPGEQQGSDSVFASFDEERPPEQEESRFGKLDFGENFSFGRD